MLWVSLKEKERVLRRNSVKRTRWLKNLKIRKKLTSISMLNLNWKQKRTRIKSKGFSNKSWESVRVPDENKKPKSTQKWGTTSRRVGQVSLKEITFYRHGKKCSFWRNGSRSWRVGKRIPGKTRGNESSFRSTT
jgi:hypothetical protein